MRKFTQIQGLSQIRRLPLLGRIRGGIKVRKKDGDKRCQHKPEEICFYCSYPRETPHFIVPPDVARVYGEEPTTLDIMLPVNDITAIFPQSYEYYGTGRGLKCSGDGTQAMRFDEESKSMVDVPCPCELLEQKKCMQRGHLSIMLPKVSVGGIFMMTTTSFHSIVDINSSLDYVTALIGRFAMVPLKLKREPRETHHDGKKQIHYTCRIELEGNIDFLNALRENNARILAGPQYVLPAPQRENPAYDDGPVYPEEVAEGGKVPASVDPPPAKTPEILPPQTSEVLEISREYVMARIVAIKTKEDIETFWAWSESNKNGISKLPQEDTDSMRSAFKKKEGEVGAAEQAELIKGFETALKSSATVVALDKTMELIEKSVRDNPAKVKLRMVRDKKAQEIKKGAA